MRNNLGLLGVCTILSTAMIGCQDAPEALAPSQSITAICNVTLTRLQSNPLSVAAGSHNNDAAWHIKNNDAGSIILTGETRTMSGNITATHHSNWAPFPYTLGPGKLIDADLLYDAGGVGSGTVGMTVAANCGNLHLPTYNVTIH